MSFWSLFDDGRSAPHCKSWREKFLFRCGHYLANRHARVTIGKNCLIHPSAKICPRNGEIVIGDNCIIAMGTCIQGNVRIGNNCSVQMNGNIVGYGNHDDQSGVITIGDDSRIAANCMMIACNHNFADPEKPIREQGVTPAPITVGRDVWLGGYVKITAGCTIGEGSVLGMGSVVTKDIPPYSIAVGVPAKAVKSRKAIA
ncbi:MAG: acetyltransferase [Planctomycetes bacterium]|nr:acetyltransferase [Planctomycetota bacterium]